MRAQQIVIWLSRVLSPRKASRFAAWVCVTSIGALSVIPGGQIARTDLSGHDEHVLAYAGTAFITAVGYAERGVAKILFALLFYAGALEFLQRFSPGRNSRFEDFLFSC